VSTDTAQGVITPDAAAHVLWHYKSGGGYEPGSFVRKLIEAIAAADVVNRQRLALGFPAYVAAVNLADRSTNGLVALEAISEGERETALARLAKLEGEASDAVSRSQARRHDIQQDGPTP
jgi:hypothetical protein